MNAPIIFIHKNDSQYLKYTLESAKLFNPEKRVILLGDESNKKYTKLGIEHYCVDDYNTCDAIKKFDAVYQFVAGEKVHKTKWVEFVLRRWFHMYEFITKHSIQSFWTFDSDTLILTPLILQEKKYINFDCTEQCNESCMNGFISNVDVVRQYIDKINEIFQRDTLLNQFKKDVKLYPDHALTEMFCYKIFKEETPIKTFKLKSIIDGETFDQCLCSADEMDVYPYSLYGNKVKKIFFSKSGDIYSFHKPSQQFVKLNTINMSWLPIYLFKKILNHSKKKLSRKAIDEIEGNQYILIDIRESSSNKILNRIYNKCYRVIYGNEPQYDLY